MFLEICKRNAHFVSSCLVSKSNLVRFVTWHGMAIARYKSCVGSNALFCCNYFNWRSDEFLLGNIDLRNDFFVQFSDSSLSFADFNTACSLLEVLYIREGFLFVEDERVRFSRKDLDIIIKTLSCSY